VPNPAAGSTAFRTRPYFDIDIVPLCVREQRKRRALLLSIDAFARIQFLPMPIRILGIESSCDETAAAVVSGGRDILSSVVSSQIDIHRKYGGVVPELASREHLRQIVPVVREALERAGLSFQEIDAIGVTQGPGLVGSLLVGMTYGRVLAAALGKPLISVNHLEGHIHAVFLEAHLAGRTPQLPAVCLIVSGGHTLLYEVTAAHAEKMSSTAADVTDATPQFQYRRLGGTRDDAAGEAYDKVAKLLALGYPGGPILDALAKPITPHANGADSGHAASSGDPNAIAFASPKMKGNALDFSFSGIKTAVLYYIRANPNLQQGIENRRAALTRGERTAAQLRPLCDQQTLDLIASFQRSVVTELVNRTLAGADLCGVRTILVSGGVAANRELRARFESEAQSRGIKVFFPSRELSTDNAAMIAAAAFARLTAGATTPTEFEPLPKFPLGISL
jgi:N6-L-threonylcarbamoyladenine synthase